MYNEDAYYTSLMCFVKRLMNDERSLNFTDMAKGDLSGIKRNFVKSLQDLQSTVREKLLTTPIELEERKYYIGKVVQRENKILKIKEKLQMDYDQQIKMKEEEVYWIHKFPKISHQLLKRKYHKNLWNTCSFKNVGPRSESFSRTYS